MSSQDWLSEKLAQYKDDPEFILESVLFDITEKISLEMKKSGISKTELAQRLGKSKAFVTRILKGNHNMTLKTLLSISMAMNLKLNVDLKSTESIHSYSQGFKDQAFENCVLNESLDLTREDNHDPIPADAA